MKTNPKYVKSWYRKLKELKVFFRKHGHFRVPRHGCYEKLAYWLKTQRQQYRLFQNGSQKSTMTPDRIHAMEDIGFHDWHLDYTLKKWTEHFVELKRFVKANGHSNVPSIYPPNPSLGHWTRKQRYQYRLLKEGLSSPMTLQHIQKLESIGFQWGDTSTKRSNQCVTKRSNQCRKWSNRFHQLEAFVESNGHADVPQLYRENPSLGKWVKNQRTQYRLE